jgi:hypothetical protein
MMKGVVMVVIFGAMLLLSPWLRNATAQSSVTASLRNRWRVPTYEGLTLGKSKRLDVERVFGRPEWSGHPEDAMDNPIPSLISYEYENVGAFDGRTVIIMDRRSEIVAEIYLYPDYRKPPITLKDVLARYGELYTERDGALGPCPTAQEISRYKPPPQRKFPFLMLYPGRGMYVSIDSDLKVQAIVFLRKCA